MAGKYTRKDDSVSLVRLQSIFAAPEEIVEPSAATNKIITGDCRCSHNMLIMPGGIKSPITGPYCLPIASVLGFSMDRNGSFAHGYGYADFFGGSSFDQVRLNVQNKAIDLRRQGFFGIIMASKTELAYTGLEDTLNARESQFETRQDERPGVEVSSAAGDPD